MHPTLDPEAIGSIPLGALESFLKEQRWYGAKSKKLVEHTAVDVINLESQDVPLAIALIETRFDDDSKETYQLVLSPRGERDEILHDALGDPRACLALYEIIRDHDEFAGASGRVRIRRGRGFQKDHFDVSSIEPLDQEQSNSSVVFGDAFFLKLFRNVVFGLNPDFEISLFLMQHPLFNHSPKLYAALEYARPDSSATLAFVQEYIHATGSGIEYASEAVKGYLDNPSPETLRAFAPAAKQLGAILGELHLALASDEESEAFSPEPFTDDNIVEMWSSLSQQLEKLTPCFGDSDDTLLQLWQEVATAFTSLEPITDAGLRVRTHGDYHLGQVLRVNEEWMILDFEGEPNRPLEERRRKNSPLRDVAIMMRSFNYVAHSVVFERAQPGADGWDLQQRHAGEWESAMRDAFLQGYFSLMERSAILPAREADRQRLLNVFELERAITELSYDLDNRPDWTHICLHSIRRILGLGDIELANRA
jgi:trehalose synthase-fused probable maltokinase